MGYFAYDEYLNYRFEVVEAEYLAQQPPPAPVPLSELTRRDANRITGEIAIDGLYFTGLPETTIDPFGIEKDVILLADEQGREIGAALVVTPAQKPVFRQELSAQGSGDRYRVTVFGYVNDSTEWAQLVDARLAQLGLPSSGGVVIVEPFVGGREAGLLQHAEKAMGLPVVLGGLGGLLGLMGLARFFQSSAGSSSQPAPQRRPNTPPQQPTPPQQGTAPSPWGPNPSPTPASAANIATAKALVSQGQNQPAARQKPAPTRDATSMTDPEAIPALPDFKSVFPGGGSGFRFKTADEIIRETFGTVSMLNKPSPPPKG